MVLQDQFQFANLPKQAICAYLGECLENGSQWWDFFFLTEEVERIQMYENFCKVGADKFVAFRNRYARLGRETPAPTTVSELEEWQKALPKNNRVNEIIKVPAEIFLIRILTHLWTYFFGPNWSLSICKTSNGSKFQTTISKPPPGHVGK